jgi:hypothetical protein
VFRKHKRLIHKKAEKKMNEYHKRVGFIEIVQLLDEKRLNIEILFKHLNMLIDLAMLLVKPKYVYVLCES